MQLIQRANQDGIPTVHFAPNVNMRQALKEAQEIGQEIARHLCHLPKDVRLGIEDEIYDELQPTCGADKICDEFVSPKMQKMISALLGQFSQSVERLSDEQLQPPVLAGEMRLSVQCGAAATLKRATRKRPSAMIQFREDFPDLRV